MRNILSFIGDTPLVSLTSIGDEIEHELLGKCEHLNPGGSVKDRIALEIVNQAEEQGLLSKGGTLVEATAGNTGVGLALVAALRGYNLICVMPEKMSEDKKQALRALGAEVVVTQSVPPDHPQNFQNVARKIAEDRDNCFWTNQFANGANPKVHERTTAVEIWEQTQGKLSAFVTGVGTGGTITGVGRYLKRMNPDIQIILADPVGSKLADLINHGQLGREDSYLVEGIGSSVVPEVFDPSVIDFAISVSDAEGFAMTHRLVREEGLLVGGSSGFSVAAACRASQHIASKGPIVALLQDSWDRYWSKLFSPEWMKANVDPV